MYSSYNLLHKLHNDIGRLAKIWDCFLKEQVSQSVWFLHA